MQSNQVKFKDKINMKQSKIEYKPSFAAKLAKVILPMLQLTLPEKLYKRTYDTSYSSYKNLLNLSYNFILAKSYLSGNRIDILRSQLTKQLLPYTMGGRKALETAFNTMLLIEQEGINGVIVECGVAEGGTAAMLALANLKAGSYERNKWFFDSYEGLPEPTQDDYSNGKAGHFIRPLPKGACLGTIEQVSDLLFNKLSISREKTKLIKGWFQNTIPQHTTVIGEIAVLRLDGDWYESTKIPLENFYPLVSKGGYIIIDDYATCFGSRKAVDEYLELLNINAELLPDGRGGAWFRKP